VIEGDKPTESLARDVDEMPRHAGAYHVTSDFSSERDEEAA
jgi:hypothetical protein